jgi:hypothetical protein
VTSKHMSAEWSNSRAVAGPVATLADSRPFNVKERSTKTERQTEDNDVPVSSPAMIIQPSRGSLPSARRRRSSMSGQVCEVLEKVLHLGSDRKGAATTSVTAPKGRGRPC